MYCVDSPGRSSVQVWSTSRSTLVVGSCTEITTAAYPASRYAYLLRLTCDNGLSELASIRLDTVGCGRQ